MEGAVATSSQYECIILQSEITWILFPTFALFNPDPHFIPPSSNDARELKRIWRDSFLLPQKKSVK